MHRPNSHPMPYHDTCRTVFHALANKREIFAVLQPVDLPPR